MANGNGQIALQVHREECNAAIGEIMSSAAELRKAGPAHECPAPAFSRAVAAGMDAIGRGQVALLRVKVAEIENAQTIIVEHVGDQREIRRAVRRKVYVVASILVALGIGAMLRSLDSILEVLRAIVAR